jgi:dienelactone hydrolase
VSYLRGFVCLVFCCFIFAHTEIIEFESANPFSLKDIITNLDNQEKQTVIGILTIPDNITGKVPLVIGAAGSKGWGSHHFEYLKMYQDSGIATLQLQSFKSRDETSTVGTQNTVTIPMIILDSYRALEALSSHPSIDIENVAITGWSLGGGVTLYSGWKPVMDAIDSDYKFAAHLAFYPPCFSEPETIEFTDSPIHILIGELDEWVPADACVDLVNLMQFNDIDANVTVYKGAHHSFDRDQEIMIAEGGYSFTDCRFKMNDDGAVLMNFMNIPMTNWFTQMIGFSFCADRNPRFGGHPDSREKSFKFTKEFMIKHLLH